jgi:hypothetical protein
MQTPKFLRNGRGVAGRPHDHVGGGSSAAGGRHAQGAAQPAPAPFSHLQ